MIPDDERMRGPAHRSRSFEQQATFAILRAAEAVRRRLAAAIEPYGVTVQQYHVLRILRDAGPAGLPTLTVAERMIEHTPGVTRLLDRLQGKRLVERSRSETDRRLVVCSLTSAGARLLERIEPSAGAAGTGAVGALTSDEVVELVRLLEAVRSED